MDIILSDLRGRLAFGGTVAARIWQAWWQPAWTPLDHVTDRVAEALSPSGLPLVLVVHAEDRLLGTASLIASELGSPTGLHALGCGCLGRSRRSVPRNRLGTGAGHIQQGFHVWLRSAASVRQSR